MIAFDSGHRRGVGVRLNAGHVSENLRVGHGLEREKKRYLLFFGAGGSGGAGGGVCGGAGGSAGCDGDVWAAVRVAMPVAARVAVRVMGV